MGKGHGRVKVKKIGTDDNEQLSEMFNQMLGGEMADPEIVYPKYIKIMNLINRFGLILTSFCSEGEDAIIRSLFPHLGEILNGAQLLGTACTDLYKARKTSAEEFVSADYAELKKNDITNQLVVVASELAHYKQYISSSQSLSDRFIRKSPGQTCVLFEFMPIDFYLIWASPEFNNNLKKYILTVLNVMYTITIDIAQTSLSPDIDVDKFSHILIDRLCALEGTVPNCGKAFSKIRKSVDLLKTNFSDYYADFVESKNPASMFDSFVSDIAKSQEKLDTDLIVQFRRIINHYRKATSGKIKDPRVSKLLDTLSEKIEMLKTHAPKETPDTVPDSDSDSESDSEDK